MEIKSNSLEFSKLPKSRSRLVVGIQSVASQSTFLVVGSEIFRALDEEDELMLERQWANFHFLFGIYLLNVCDSIDWLLYRSYNFTVLGRVLFVMPGKKTIILEGKRNPLPFFMPPWIWCNFYFLATSVTSHHHM